MVFGFGELSCGGVRFRFDWVASILVCYIQYILDCLIVRFADPV